MENSVRITAKKDGTIFTLATNPDGSVKLDKNEKRYGFIRCVEETINLGFTQNKALDVRSALKNMTEDVFKSAAHKLVDGAEVAGHRICRKDQLEPHYVGQKAQQLPMRDKAGNIIEGKFVPLTSGGKPVFRREFVTNLDSDKDALLVYDKVNTVDETATASSKKAETVIAD